MGMNSRQRFLETMQFGQPDRVPYFAEGIRDDVLKVWRKQGLAADLDPAHLFHIDHRVEIMPELEPQPYPDRWPEDKRELAAFERRLDPLDDGRLPADWSEKVKSWQDRDYPLILRVHQGILQTLGIMDWHRFTDVMLLMIEKPDIVREMMAMQASFACRLMERILQKVEVDAVIFSEPIAGNSNPLISPQMYEDLALTSYGPILELVRRYGVETIIIRTYANTRILIPKILKWGFNCLWACEVNATAMDYGDIRHEYGRDLRLVGGIDTDVLRQDKAAIQREVEEKVPPLLADGGYIPLADGRIRVDIPFDNYNFYRRLLEKVTTN